MTDSFLYWWLYLYFIAMCATIFFGWLWASESLFIYPRKLMAWTTLLFPLAPLVGIVLLIYLFCKGVSILIKIGIGKE